MLSTSLLHIRKYVDHITSQLLTSASPHQCQQQNMQVPAATTTSPCPPVNHAFGTTTPMPQASDIAYVHIGKPCDVSYLTLASNDSSKRQNPKRQIDGQGKLQAYRPTSFIAERSTCIHPVQCCLQKYCTAIRPKNDREKRHRALDQFHVDMYSTFVPKRTENRKLACATEISTFFPKMIQLRPH